MLSKRSRMELPTASRKHSAQGVTAQRQMPNQAAKLYTKTLIRAIDSFSECIEARGNEMGQLSGMAPRKSDA
jgi:hypothetical protein